MSKVLKIINAYEHGYDSFFKDIENIKLSTPDEEEAYSIGRDRALLEIHQGAIPLDYSIGGDEWL